jgi:hypothetical protein
MFYLLTAILAVVVWIAIRQEVMHMATKQDFVDIADSLGSGIADVRSDIQKLKDSIGSGGLTAQEEDEAKALLQAKLDELKALADENT